MEEKNESKRFETTRDLARTALFAYIAVKVVKATGAVVRDSYSFVSARKANKAAEEK